jgi:hypothetical protein
MESTSMGHRIRLDDAPAAWHRGLPLGNGEFGAMVWGDGRPLAFTLDRADLWDLRASTAHRDDPRYTYEGLRRLVAAERFAEAKEVFEDRELRGNPVGPTKISIGRVELDLGGAPLGNFTPRPRRRHSHLGGQLRGDHGHLRHAGPGVGRHRARLSRRARSLARR